MLSQLRVMGRIVGVAEGQRSNLDSNTDSIYNCMTLEEATQPLKASVFFIFKRNRMVVDQASKALSMLPGT